MKNFLEQYWTNPQYLIRLNFVDDNDDENLCTMIIALMQKETRQRRLSGLPGEDYVQFRVFKVRCHYSLTVDMTFEQQREFLLDDKHLEFITDGEHEEIRKENLGF